ncbi:RadC family protein [Hirschia baltica]|uniref:DNA repair protein RadC n=1 Tax=Hirschia baltica (strain ATCC 49814 / DSM 5838 / IFAM 1418) TaxID=582402 RepID=C6XNR3_HIRBI|nr:DNA repair protein RadC [Hirschia baltica]ACT58316.1 DNA repair protein RadC [Hirschia baltica ATCC 49814]
MNENANTNSQATNGEKPNGVEDGLGVQYSSTPLVSNTPAQPAAKPKSKPVKHYHGHRDRLRDRVLQGHGNTLPDYELLELLLFAFIPRRDVKPVAKALIDKFGGISGVMAAPIKRLKEVDGIGETCATYIQATHLLNQRCSLEEVKARPIISNWGALLSHVRIALQHETEEQFRVLFLDHKNQLIADERQSQGTINHAPVYPRELAKRALELSASALILVHNHPSGDPTPSRADIDVTREIMDAFEPLEITIHDHLIVGKKGITSLKAKNLI